MGQCWPGAEIGAAWGKVNIQQQLILTYEFEKENEIVWCAAE